MLSSQTDVKTLSNNYLLRNFIWYPPWKQVVAHSDEDVQNRFTAGLGLCVAFYDFDGVLSSCFVGTRSFLLLVVGWSIWLLVLAAYFFVEFFRANFVFSYAALLLWNLDYICSSFETFSHLWFCFMTLVFCWCWSYIG